MRNRSEGENPVEKDLKTRFEDAVINGCVNNGPSVYDLGTEKVYSNPIRWGLYDTGSAKVGFYYHPGTPTYFVLFQSKVPKTEFRGGRSHPAYPTLVFRLEPGSAGAELSKKVIINDSPINSFMRMVLNSEPRIRSEEPPKTGEFINKEGITIRVESTLSSLEERERLNKRINDAEAMARVAGLLDVDSSEIEIIIDVSQLLQKAEQAGSIGRRRLHKQVEKRIREFSVLA